MQTAKVKDQSVQKVGLLLEWKETDAAQRELKKTNCCIYVVWGEGHVPQWPIAGDAAGHNHGQSRENWEREKLGVYGSSEVR